MIYSYDELNRLIRAKLDGLSVTTRDHTLNLTNKHIFYGVPEAEVVESRVFPAVSFHLIDDDPYERNRHQGEVYRMKVEEGTDLDTLPWTEHWPGTLPNAPFYAKWKYPEPVRLSYQFDLYSHTQQSMIELYSGFVRKLPRRRGFLKDTDGHEIQVASNHFLDFTRDIDMLGETKERVFRRTLTYTFDALLQLERIPDSLVTTIETVQLEYFADREPSPLAAPPDIMDLIREEE